MSYQFEDDSALEELLNQQLDRRKQQHTSASSAGGRPSTTTTATRPSTAILSKQTTFDGNQTQAAGGEPTSLGPPKSKMASWLDMKNSGKKQQQIATSSVPATDAVSIAVHSRGSITDMPGVYIANIQAESPTTTTTTNLTSAGVTKPNLGQVDKLLEETLKEDRLQEMSKQRLIQLIMGQVLSALIGLRAMSTDQSATEVERLKSELQIERTKVESLEAHHSEQVKLVECRWMQLNKQFELRLELSERELSQTMERQKALITQLEEEHKKQLNKLAENYQAKLVEEKQHFEVSLRRREEFHQLELESKLKVNCDLTKLETIFSEWDKMIQSTIRELDLQFKTVEGLLDKQTIEINGTNSELSKKSKLLGEQYEKFEQNSVQLGELAQQMAEILPSFSHMQNDTESVMKQTSIQLAEFVRKNDELRDGEQKLEQLKEKLASDQVKLNQERFQLGLDTNRLAYKEERLTELVQVNEETESRLAEQKRSQSEREIQIQSLRSTLDMKSNELREQNYELHLTRKRLTGKQEQLAKLEAELAGERRSARDQLVQVEEEAKKLDGLRGRVQKELSQLKRLQKSLICSICMERLFDRSDHRSLVVVDNDNNNNNKWPYEAEERQLLGSAGNERDGGKGALKRGAGRKRPPLVGSIGSTKAPTIVGLDGSYEANFEQELAKLNRHIEMDAKQLEAENKYVELLSAIN